MYVSIGEEARGLFNKKKTAHVRARDAISCPSYAYVRLGADIMFSGVLAPPLLTIEAVAVDGTMVV